MSTPNALAATGSISGTVTSASSQLGIGGVQVCAFEIRNGGEVEWMETHCVKTAPSGDYTIGSLVEGSYQVRIWARADSGLNYIGEYYSGKGSWNADPIEVGDGNVTGIDAALDTAGSIEGRVISAAGGAPLGGVKVCAYDGFEDHEPNCALTGADGRYAVVGLGDDDYMVEFLPEKSGLLYFNEYYDDGTEWGQGELVPVSFGNVTSGIDSALEPSAEVRGTVTVAATGAPLEDILVCIAPALFLSEFSFVDDTRCDRTSTSGNYTIGRLVSGQYKVVFSLEMREFANWFPPIEPEEDGYPTRYWNERDTWWDADPLLLVAPTVATGVDARLGPFPPIDPSSPAPPEAEIASPSPTPIVRRPVKPKCKGKRRAKKMNGKYRCVKPRPRKHKPRSR